MRSQTEEAKRVHFLTWKMLHNKPPQTLLVYECTSTRFTFGMRLAWNPGAVASWKGEAPSSGVPVYSEYCCIWQDEVRRRLFFILNLYVEIWSMIACLSWGTQTKAPRLSQKTTIWSAGTDGPLLLYTMYQYTSWYTVIVPLPLL